MKAIVSALLVGLAAIAQPVSAGEPAGYSETVLHSFGDGEDGQQPFAGVIDAKGVLYGTTYLGGSEDSGTVFSLDPKTDAEKVLYSFSGNPDAYPEDSLIAVKGVLYGTTSGQDSPGTMFALDLSTDAEKTLYEFCRRQKCADGDLPTGGLIDVKGTLYGTTYLGGHGGGDCGSAGCGTVFSYDPKTVAQKVLYTFCNQTNCTDGDEPFAGLIDVNGVLYGTTYSGGTEGSGTVFSVDPKTGSETVLHDFGGVPDGADGGEPGSVIDVNGTLYGTTFVGGKIKGCDKAGCGTVFSLDPETGAEKVLYAFCSQPNCADGAFPERGLIDVKGTLYDTTVSGGAYNYGTVFVLKKTR